jgi:hypothetical protein
MSEKSIRRTGRVGREAKGPSDPDVVIRVFGEPAHPPEPTSLKAGRPYVLKRALKDLANGRGSGKGTYRL